MLNLNDFVHVFFSLKLAQLESKVLAYKNVCFNSKNKYSIPSLTNHTLSCEGPFTIRNICWGVCCTTYAKKFHCKHFGVSPFRPQELQGLHLTWKLWVNPIENHIKVFPGKFVVIFFKPSLGGSKLVRTPFLHHPPPTGVCKRSLS